MNQETHRYNTIGVIACAFAFVSAAVHGGAFYLAQHIGDRAGLAIYLCEDGVGFTLNKNVWIITGAANCLAVVGLVFFLASCLTHRPLVSLLNLAALIFLLPTVYTVGCLLVLFLQ